MHYQSQNYLETYDHAVSTANETGEAQHLYVTEDDSLTLHSSTPIHDARFEEITLIVPD